MINLYYLYFSDTWRLLEICGKFLRILTSLHLVFPHQNGTPQKHRYLLCLPLAFLKYLEHARFKDRIIMHNSIPPHHDISQSLHFSNHIVATIIGISNALLFLINVHIWIVFLSAFLAYTVAKFYFRMFMDIRFNLGPITFIITNFFTMSADGKQAA